MFEKSPYQMSVVRAKGHSSLHTILQLQADLPSSIAKDFVQLGSSTGLSKPVAGTYVYLFMLMSVHWMNLGLNHGHQSSLNLRYFL